jgi:hypothetical protein
LLNCCDMCGRVSPAPGLAVKTIQGLCETPRPLSAKMAAPQATDRRPQMSFKDLLANWRETAAQPRTATEYAVRLPLDDAARLAALAEMFPGRSPEQLITDLLETALQEIETSMPYIAGKKVISSDEQGDPIFEDIGLTPRFMELTRKNRKKLEAELPKAK